MDAVILVGGQGTRLRPVVADRPKPLAPVRGIPFLDYLIKQIEGHVSRIILAVGYLGEQVVEQYQERHLISAEKNPLGTGGAVRLAIDLVEGERFWVLNGDSYFDISFEEMERCTGDLVMAVRHVEDVKRYGAVEIEENKVITFDEKGGSSGPGWINGGIYICQKELFGGRAKRQPFSLEKELFPSLLLSNKEVMAYPCEGRFIDIGTPKSYENAGSVLIRSL